MAKFPFTDLHSFKDYVGFVKLCAPNHFPKRDGVVPEEQWTLDLAFEGLRLGLTMATEEKGQLSVFVQCGQLIDEARTDYAQGRLREASIKLQDVQKLLKKIPSQ
jgi:hypothetical protein